jgi:flagellar biosynthesis/type III secretory pathway chaperone
VTNKANTITTELYQVIAQMMTCTSDLFSLIDMENRALIQRASDVLTKLTHQKQDKLTLLEELESTRKSILSNNGYATDAQGMEHCVNDSNSEKLSSMWNSLLEQVNELQKQNRVNGNLVNLTQRSVEYALNILQGQIPDNKLYDIAGQEINTRQSRSLAKT